MLAPARVGMPGALSDEHYRNISTLIEKQIGIRLPPNKRGMVEGRLRKRVKALNLATMEEYGNLLFEEGALGEELTHLIDCMTTNKTDFFREPAHFVILRDNLLPEIMARRKASEPRQIKVWSAACSIGAEPFTIAMVLDQAIRSYPRATYSILGTDISTDVLKHANRAIYPREMIGPVPAEMQSRYCMVARDASRKEIRISPELRKTVRFQHLNLMDKSYPVDRDMDIIFCRNILIYFSRAIQEMVVSHLVSHLRPGGHLILGHSESMAGGNQPELGQAYSTVFRKLEGNEEPGKWKRKEIHRSAS